MKLYIVVGARPNFMKAAAVHEALAVRGAEVHLVHTGQHFDREMSEVFFEVLGLPRPSTYLGVGSASRVSQFAAVALGLGRLFESERPDRVLVVGDVTSTAAGAVAADACDIAVAHVEAGLRSFDLTMPEERNRRVADVLSDVLFVSEDSGVTNLKNEGKPASGIYLVGNVMIDTLLRFLPLAEAAATWSQFGLLPGEYALATVHRPSNVDTPTGRRSIASVLSRVAARVPVIFPVHPRTRHAFEAGRWDLGAIPGLRLSSPLDYVSFLSLLAAARVVLTDSGGIQEETTALRVPCLTLRQNTERPVTLVENGGSSVLVGCDAELVEEEVSRVLAGKYPTGGAPELWDGKAAERIASVLLGR